MVVMVAGVMVAGWLPTPSATMPNITLSGQTGHAGMAGNDVNDPMRRLAWLTFRTAATLT
jgi:hypothetical protein